MNWVMSFLHLPTRVWQTHPHVLELNCNSSPHHMTLIKDHWTAWKRCEDYFHSSNSLIQISVKSLPLYISPSSGLFFISPDEDLLFEVETSWVKLLCKFQCWWSELNWHCKCYQIQIQVVKMNLFNQKNSNTRFTVESWTKLLYWNWCALNTTQVFILSFRIIYSI